MIKKKQRIYRNFRMIIKNKLRKNKRKLIKKTKKKQGIYRKFRMIIKNKLRKTIKNIKLR